MQASAYRLGRLAGLRAEALDLGDDIHALGHMAKHHVAPVQPRRLDLSSAFQAKQNKKKQKELGKKDEEQRKGNVVEFSTLFIIIIF